MRSSQPRVSIVTPSSQHRNILTNCSQTGLPTLACCCRHQTAALRWFDFMLCVQFENWNSVKARPTNFLPLATILQLFMAQCSIVAASNRQLHVCIAREGMVASGCVSICLLLLALFSQQSIGMGPARTVFLGSDHHKLNEDGQIEQENED